MVELQVLLYILDKSPFSVYDLQVFLSHSIVCGLSFYEYF